ncbi:unnamed protein product [Peniophora sp. CBMAI 1063]|nr:unnamed protein product [Peniophora sp. CBMAI 1063]
MSRLPPRTRGSRSADGTTASPSPHDDEDRVWELFEKSDAEEFKRVRDDYMEKTAGASSGAASSLVKHPIARTFFEETDTSQCFQVRLAKNTTAEVRPGCIVALAPKIQDNAAEEPGFFLLVTDLIYEDDATPEEEEAADEEETEQEQKRGVRAVSGVYLESLKYMTAALKQNKIWGKDKISEFIGSMSGKPSWFITNERAEIDVELIIGVPSDAQLSALGIEVSSDARLLPKQRKDGKRQYQIDLFTGTPEV